MKARVLMIMLLIAGLIHIGPLIGVLGPESLGKLYGLEINEPNLEILMRHRAVLFGILGLFILYSAFKPKLQGLAIIGAYISVISFLLLAWQVPGSNPALQKVALMDWIALASLLIASVLYFMRRKQ